MRVKRFVADSTQEAVSLVRKEFGPEALIIQTRKVRRGGILAWFRRPQYEVLAAFEGAPPRSRIAPVKPMSPPTVAPATVMPSREELAPLASGGSNTASAQKSEAWSGEMAALHQHLLNQDVEKQLATQLVESVKVRASDGAQLQDVKWLDQTIRTCIAGQLSCIDPAEVGTNGRVIPLIGPTGVGKTTTIAKLAANFALLADKRVAIITSDTYRIAAVEQLKTYADLIRVPLDVVYSPEELKQAIDRHAAKDLVFVDTAGRSQRHNDQMRELHSFMSVIDKPLTHLVMSATTKLPDALEIASRFGSVPFERVIITKVDETSSLGTILSVNVRTSKQLAYLTNGQNVPDDIEVAEASRIADLIMRGGV